MARTQFASDFKTFISKGNVIDLGVAVVIGAAFNKIVTSLVNDIIMPLISLIAGGLNVTDWKWIIKEAQYDVAGNITKAETSLNYGNFIQNIIDFIIVAFTIFIVLRAFTKLQNRRMKNEKGLEHKNDE
ncbi:MAG: large conductance mechanosensitive channel protein MscL [Clostridia bacterium]|nr:large conductance mechanosensitive channel protein MscL [Clostridia bacterium]